MRSHHVDFSPHPDASKFEKGEKVVYYQENPLPNWGPGSKAKSYKSTTMIGTTDVDAGKRKMEEENAAMKKVKVDGKVDVEEEAMVNG